jgi:NitT/TauT family transport system substrate-binding protein
LQTSSTHNQQKQEDQMANRRLWIGIVTASIVSAICVSVNPAALAQTGSVRVAVTSKSLIYAPLYVAQRRGMFEKQGLKLEILDAGGGTKVAAGLAGGSIVAAMMAIDHVFAATTREQKWVMFGQLMNKEPYTFAMRKDIADAKGITASSPFAERLKSLEGTTIAVSALGSGTQLALASAMERAGVSPEKARWVPIGEPMAIVTAVERKQVEVGGRAPGPAEILVDRGTGVMVVDFSKDQLGKPYPTIVIATTAQQLKDRGPDLRKMMLALREALNFTRENPEEAAKSIREDFKFMDDKAFKDAMAFDLRSLPPDVLITKEEFDGAVAQSNSPYLLNVRRGAKVDDNFDEAVDTKIGEK